MKEYVTGIPIQFKAVATTQGYSSGDHTYTWAFSDGQEFTGDSPIFTPSTAGIATGNVSATIPGSGMVATDSKSINIIDASTIKWEDIDCPIYFSGTRAAQIGDNKVLLYGNNTSDELSVRAYEFDGTTFERVGDLTNGRYLGMFYTQIAVNSFSDGKVLACGAFRKIEGTWGSRSAEIYNPSTKTWSSVPQDPFNSDNYSYGGMVNLSGDRVAMFKNNRVAIYTHSTNSWSLSAATSGWANPYIGFEIKCVALADGRVFLINEWTSDAVIYDPTSDAFSDLIPIGFVPRAGTTMAEHEGYVWMFDADTLKPVIKIELSTGDVTNIATTLASAVSTGIVSPYASHIFLDRIQQVPRPPGLTSAEHSAFFNIATGALDLPRSCNGAIGYTQPTRFTIDGFPYILGSDGVGTPPYTPIRRFNMRVK